MPRASLFALSAAIVLGTPALTVAQQPGPAPTVKVMPAQRHNVSAVTYAPGTVVSRHDARIAAEVSGRLTWVAEVGDELAAGDAIARIDDTALQIQLRDDEANIRRLEASVRYLDQQTRRLEQLAAENVAARDQLDASLSEKAMAEQDLVRAMVNRDRTLHQIERSTVRVPFAGAVVQRFGQPGEYIGVGGEIARLVDTREIEVRAQAPILVAPYLRNGLEVLVVDGEQELHSALRTFVPVGDERSRMIEVRVELPQGSWFIGAPVRVALPRSDAAEAVAVPRDALILREDSTYVFKVTDGDTVERIVVEPGHGSGGFVEIRGDVAPGDRIVVRGGERLEPGQAVLVSAES